MDVMRRRGNKNPASPGGQTKIMRCSDLPSPKRSSSNIISTSVLGMAMIVVIGSILFVLIYLAFPSISSERKIQSIADTSKGSKRNTLLRGQSEEARLEIKGAKHTISKPTVALPNVLLIEAGTSAVRINTKLL
jgi:hypothetical protein